MFLKRVFTLLGSFVRVYLVAVRVIEEQKKMDFVITEIDRKPEAPFQRRTICSMIKEINADENQWKGFSAEQCPNKHGKNKDGIRIGYKNKVGGVDTEMSFDLEKKALGVNFEINI